jgi:hypothetical protein
MIPGWTVERVTMLAHDTKAAYRSRALADPSRWDTLAYGLNTVWGVYQGSAETPYRVTIDLVSMEMVCTCSSTIEPCKHALALLYMAVGQPHAFTECPLPEDVVAWLGVATVKARKKGIKMSTDFETRKAQILDGINELELWLDNMIRHGLGDPQVQDHEYWEARAARMVDAHAPELANWLRQMAKIPASNANWVEQLLGELGRLHLVIEGFKRFDTLPADTQADLRTVVGWSIKPEELDDVPGVTDYWVVLGKREVMLNPKLKVQRLWLRGKETGRNVLLREFTRDGVEFENPDLAPGQALPAEIVFYPGRYPLRAFIRQRNGELESGHVVRGASIHENVQVFGSAISQNPWLQQFPFLLDAVIPVRHEDDAWIVREIDGTYLPLHPEFEHPWPLLALGGGHPITVAGEWSGMELLPTGAIVDGRFVDFNLVGKF